ncbi:hypothetical protein IWX64_003118 [Arthrobacter sp. CAN_A212]|uniref:hypothetical protein n=1 Tax=Arthrobacter sp. CAN_A212 TaxID=2787719 RepID=UPI0018CAAEFF
MDALRVRYMEDYRNADGWEEHRKGLCLNGVSVFVTLIIGTRQLHPLNEAITELVHCGLSWTGRPSPR